VVQPLSRESFVFIRSRITSVVWTLALLVAGAAFVVATGSARLGGRA